MVERVINIQRVCTTCRRSFDKPLTNVIDRRWTCPDCRQAYWMTPERAELAVDTMVSETCDPDLTTADPCALALAEALKGTEGDPE